MPINTNNNTKNSNSRRRKYSKLLAVMFSVSYLCYSAPPGFKPDQATFTQTVHFSHLKLDYTFLLPGIFFTAWAPTSQFVSDLEASAERNFQ